MENPVSTRVPQDTHGEMAQWYRVTSGRWDYRPPLRSSVWQYLPRATQIIKYTEQNLLFLDTMCHVPVEPCSRELYPRITATFSRLTVQSPKCPNHTGPHPRPTCKPISTEWGGGLHGPHMPLRTALLSQACPVPPPPLLSQAPPSTCSLLPPANPRA